MIPRKKIFIFILSCSAILFIGSVLGVVTNNKKTDSVTNMPISGGMWQYQCIDTMKYSRDTARAWKNKEEELQKLISTQLTAIKKMGGNCVAIGTPYEEEFVPFMKLWVAKAHDLNLMVWFRGNIAGWEGWFGYPRLTSAAEHHAEIYGFITRHPELFSDQDIFTPSPEPENGILGSPWKNDQSKQDLRIFIEESYANCLHAFSVIGKATHCGYFSTNGDVAKNILTSDSIAKSGGVVAVDHYVASAQRLITDLLFFHDQYHAFVFLGEFGAPIPDIHGAMTQQQQADFINQQLQQLYIHKDIIQGVNYWVLSGGSTQLLNDDGTERQATAIIRNYFLPTSVAGTVTDGTGNPLVGAEVNADHGNAKTTTNSRGQYLLVLPVGLDTDVSASLRSYIGDKAHMTTKPSFSVVENFVITPEHPSIIYRIKTFIHAVRK